MRKLSGNSRCCPSNRDNKGVCVLNGFSVDFALLLYDEFNGAAIVDANVLFRAEGRPAVPLRKREGFYIFRGFPQPEVNVEISRHHYQKKWKNIIKNSLDPGFPVERVRLFREFPGAFPDCEWMQASCPPGSEVIAFGGVESRVGATDKDGEGAKISLPGYSAAALLGRRFALKPDGGETFILTRQISPGVYRLDTPPPNPGKGGGFLYRAYRARGDPDGVCRFPVEKGKGDKITTAVCREKEGAKWVPVSVTALR